jgi:Holliday junction DNA helicase RuvA
MISRISGQLVEVTTNSAMIEVGGLWYEVLVPACDVGRLSAKIGREIVLYTIHIVEGDPSRGSTVPRLIGFLAEEDRAFFKAFTTVKGIGVRKALRALVRPVAEVAAAIENKDDKLLKSLPEIGKRTAETIIAELNGKVGDFAGEIVAAEPDALPLSDAGREAVAALVQLGEKRPDAESLVERVLKVEPDLTTAEQIIPLAFKLKAK